MGGKGKKRREKNYLRSHGGNKRLPAPPNSSSYADVMPSKLRKLLSLTSSPGSEPNSQIDDTQLKPTKRDASQTKSHFKAQEEPKSADHNNKAAKVLPSPQVANESKQKLNDDADEVKKQKKRKRNEVNDLRFEAEMEKLGVISKRKQRKKEYLKAKKKKKEKKGASGEELDQPKRDHVKFGEVVQAPPKLAVIPKAPKKPMDASRERLRLQAIEAYRSRKGWTNRLGAQLPSLSTSSDL